tara:strand:+ start:243 stop:395 length:153 start_codon:yes stop_codon:yes gene_type:complete
MDAVKQEIYSLDLPKQLKTKSKSNIQSGGANIISKPIIKKKRILPPNFLE